MGRRVCVVFDIDDTLYLERDYVRSGFEEVGRWVAEWLHLDNFAERCWNRFLEGARQSIFNDVLSEIGISPNPQLISSLVEMYRCHQPAISLADDARATLHELHGQFPISVISDGPVNSQTRKVQQLGLCQIAAPVILTEIFGLPCRKPSAWAFKEVQRLRLAEAFVYIGDNPLKDFCAPKQLGWLTVRVNRPGALHHEVVSNDSPPDIEIPDLYPLPELLTQL